MVYDVARVRGLYSSLSDGWTYLNAHARPQVPERVSAAVSRSFRMAPEMVEAEIASGTHSRSVAPGQVHAERMLAEARRAVAVLADAQPECVVLGPNLPVLYRTLAEAMAPLLRRSSVVLSKLDPPALTSAWERHADVRWAQPDLSTGDLPAWQYDSLVDGSTRLVALSAAQAHLGAVAPVADIAERVHARSRAWVLVEASTFAAYRVLSPQEWGADIVALDLAALGGPQLAALVFRTPGMFRRLQPLVAGAEGAAGLEFPVAPGLAGGASALADHLADLTEQRGSRRVRVEKSLAEYGRYIDNLTVDLIYSLESFQSIHILGVSGEAADGGVRDRVPRLSFGVHGVPADVVYQRLIDNHLVTTLTPRLPLLQDMGIDDLGGAVTVGLGPFTTPGNIDQLMRTVASLA